MEEYNDMNNVTGKDEPILVIEADDDFIKNMNFIAVYRKIIGVLGLIGIGFICLHLLLFVSAILLGNLSKQPIVSLPFLFYNIPIYFILIIETIFCFFLALFLINSIKSGNALKNAITNNSIISLEKAFEFSSDSSKYDVILLVSGTIIAIVIMIFLPGALS